jgi:cytochrome o ubiquinol oxidase subunit II
MGYLVSVSLSSICAASFLGSCSNVLLFDPKGPIADAERFLIIAAFALMLIVVIPVFIMTFWFARRYRASNSKAVYMPKWSHSAAIDLLIWLVPFAIITALGILAWNETYRLDPYKPIDSNAKPVKIEAVSLDWNWLFIYPDYDIAVINQLVFPANVPLSFKITSGTVMTSFFIPQLGSQIYAMAGMETRLNLMASEYGIYYGQNQQFSGRGFSDMNFKATATSREQFEGWVKKVKQSSNKLDLPRYEELEKPSIGYPVTHFSVVTPGLFLDIMRKYNPSMNASHGMMNNDSVPLHRRTVALEGR